MKKKCLFLAACIAIASVTLACLNEHHSDKHGNDHSDFYLEDLRLYKKHNKAELEKSVADLLTEKLDDAQDTLWNRNSLAVNYIKLGRLDEAEKILDQLFRKYPNDYVVIVNLGTLYELQGNNKRALEYIKKAMLIDPGSHNGSEWFHVRVLEYKLKNLPESSIASNDILQINTRKEGASELAEQISYQLQERIPFTPAPNLLMAKILKEYGDFLADSVSIKGAYVIYDVGRDYDKNDVFKFSQLRDGLLPYFEKNNETVPYTGIYYLDPIISSVAKYPEEVATNLLERGLDYLNKQSEERERRKRQRSWMIAGGIVLAAFVVYLFYRTQRK